MIQEAENRRQPDINTSGMMERFAGVFVLFETIIATLIVVGLFSAASQPFGWPAIWQVLLCTALGVMLWLADARLDVGESFAVAGAGRAACRQPTREET